MSSYPPEAGTGPVTYRHIRLYIETYSKVLLHKDDIGWCIRYMYIQQQLKGVAVVASDDEGPDAHEPATDKETSGGGGNLFREWNEAL